jgi:hypothetical protein
MFRITEDQSSGSLVQRLAKHNKHDSICPLTRTRSVLWQHILTRCACSQFTVYQHKYMFNHKQTTCNIQLITATECNAQLEFHTFYKQIFERKLLKCVMMVSSRMTYTVISFILHK